MARTISKNHQQKRESILAISSKVFAEVGFDRASMAQVAEECGYSKATLYHYFPSKNSILFAILDQHLSQLSCRILNLTRGILSAEDYLAYIVEEILVQYQGNDAVHELQINAIGQLDIADQEILIAHMRKLVAHVSKIISEVRPEKFSNDDKGLRMATMSLFGMLNWYYTWNGGRGIEGRKEYANFAASLFLKGI